MTMGSRVRRERDKAREEDSQGYRRSQEARSSQDPKSLQGRGTRGEIPRREPGKCCGGVGHFVKECPPTKSTADNRGQSQRKEGPSQPGNANGR